MSKEGVIKTGTDPELPHRFIKDCYELAKMPVDIALASHLNQNNILPNIPKGPDDYTVFVVDYAWADVLINRAEAVKNSIPKSTVLPDNNRLRITKAQVSKAACAFGAEKTMYQRRKNRPCPNGSL